MREQIGLLFKNCKNSNPAYFAKFNNSIQKTYRTCANIYN